MDLDPGLEQRAIHGPRRVVLHEILVTPLQQQAHPHAPAGRHDQRTAQLAAGQEVGVGDDDLLTRRANSAAVGLLDAGAVAHVVTQQQGCADAAAVVERLRCVLRRTGCAQGLQSLGQMALAHVAHGLHTPPQLLHGIAGGQHQAAGDHHRKVKPRRGQNAIVGIMKIVQYVDTATKQQVPIDHAHFAMQAAPTLRQQQPQGTERRIHLHLHARTAHAIGPCLRQAARAHTIDHEVHAHAPLGGTHQGLGHLRAGIREVKNIGLELDIGQCRIHGLDECWKKLLRTLEQPYLVVLGKVGGLGHQSLNSAISGKWSDMRHQMRPRGTCRPSGVRPRT